MIILALVWDYCSYISSNITKFLRSIDFSPMHDMNNESNVDSRWVGPMSSIFMICFRAKTLDIILLCTPWQSTPSKGAFKRHSKVVILLLVTSGGPAVLGLDGIRALKVEGRSCASSRGAHGRRHSRSHHTILEESRCHEVDPIS